MKPIVDLHRLGKCKLHGHGADLLCDFEGSVSLWR